jgi:hypothetical protein
VTHRKITKHLIRLSEGTFGYAAGESRRGMMQSDVDEADECDVDEEIDESLIRRIVQEELSSIVFMKR